MPVRLEPAGDDEVSILLRRKDLHLLLSYLLHAKFSDEIKDYVLLSPLLNELMRAIIRFSDQHFIRESGSRCEQSIPHGEIKGSFVEAVVEVLTRKLGQDGVREYLAEALYPYRLPADDAAPAGCSPD